MLYRHNAGNLITHGSSRTDSPMLLQYCLQNRYQSAEIQHRPTSHTPPLCGVPAQFAKHNALFTNVRGSGTISPTVLFLVLNYFPIIFWTGIAFFNKKNMPRNDTSEKYLFTSNTTVEKSSDIYCPAVIYHPGD